MKGRLIFALFFLGIALTEVIVALEYTAFRAKFGPLLIGGLVLCLTILQIVRELRYRHKLMSAAGEADSVVVPRKNYVTIAAWLAGLLLCTYLFGMVVVFPLFVIAYMKANRCGWLICLTLGIGIFGFLYFVFGALLRISSYRGVFL